MAPLERLAVSALDPASFDEVIDVRAPIEFAEDHLPGAVNLPVLDDAERAEIGTIYRQRSPFEARRLGAALIAARISGLLRGHFESKPKGYHPLVYCWRGGQRSQSLASILQSIGWRVSILDGGYKAWRNFLTADLADRCSRIRFAVVGGPTGCGKTRLLDALAADGAQVLDLERLANHRGSLLGDEPGGQPAQRLFESRIHTVLARFDPARAVIVEAESPKIGKLHIPLSVWQGMRSGILLEVETPLDVRVDLLLDGYPHFLNAPETLAERLRPLARFRGHATIERWLALAEEKRWREFVAALLVEHYDIGYGRALRLHHGDPVATLALADTGPAALADLVRQTKQAILAHGWVG